MSKPRRNRKAVDYSKLGHVEGYSDEENIAVRGTNFSDDSDEFKLEEDDGENDDDEEMNEAGDSHGNTFGGPSGIKEEAMEDYQDLLNNEPTNEEEEEFEGVVPLRQRSSSLKPTNISGRADAPDVQLPPLAKKPGKNLTQLLAESVNDSPAPSRKNAENLKERFQSYYGFNDDRLVYAINQRSRWGDMVFCPDANLFEVPESLKDVLSKSYFQPNVELDQQLIHLENGPTAEYLPDPAYRITCQLNVESQPLVIQPFHFAVNENPNITNGTTSVVLNAGAHVTSVRWAMDRESEFQYLAVGTLDQYGAPSAENIAAPEIGMFSTQGYPSSIQIYQVSPNLEARLFSTISTDYGSPIHIRWRPVRVNRDATSIGIIAACFQDGKVRIFDIPESFSPEGKPMHYKLYKPLREYGLEDDKITCVTWRTPEVIAVGTADGFISEFDMSDTSEEGGSLPSFYTPWHTSAIVSITAGFPDNQEFLFTSATDGFTRIVDVRDIRRSKTISARYKSYSTCTAYAPQLCSFLSLEDSFRCKLAPIRKLSTIQAGGSVTRHDGTIMAIGSSLLHPFVLSGAADGTLRIGNTVRRTMVSKRQTTSVYRQGILWQFECSERLGQERVYRFVDLLKSEQINKPSLNERQVLYPAGSVITDVDWNPNVVAGNVYASGTSCGLIRLERLST
ncbi:hypothetical protein TRICI_001928 [Trichomonascus ciferrii]|uniref:Uncharacterized protein n=1 Tax=Trichomonascus ciferrii TaxID=44093 RepID=A0A642VCB4_9ASCO|nr:hypothetical protein TRICI_001928 [Trichomonascus ciferrii]